MSFELRVREIPYERNELLFSAILFLDLVARR
jgi:hypothetical protein